MSEHSAKRRKTTAKASTGVPATDALPPELLETIFGFLGVRTLCTARLVCAQFRGAASRCIHSLEVSAETLCSRPETTLNDFPNIRRVGVCDVTSRDLVMLAQSPVAAAVTHLRAHAYFMSVPQRAQIAAGFPQLPLPNLMSLTVAFMEPTPPLFPQTLRELSIEFGIDSRAAKFVAGLTNLTSLRMDLCKLRKPFKAVTALTALQRLEICGPLSLVPFVAKLTLLTHLQLEGTWRPESLSDLAALASLSRLHRLVHLGIIHFAERLECQVLASIATFTSLRSLNLELCRRPERSAFETVLMTPFSKLTTLALESYAPGLDASFLPRFNLERLQDLSLSAGVKLDMDGVTALTRATGLTHLQLWTTTVRTSVLFVEVGIALSRMSGLRALSLGTPCEFDASALGTPDAVHDRFSLEAIALLTKLTRLELSGRGVTTNADVEVCLGLKKLRVLRMLVPDSTPAASGRITPEKFFAIAKLPELCKLKIAGDVGISGRDLSEDVLVRLNAERHAKGWPPLELEVLTRIGCYPKLW